MGADVDEFLRIHDQFFGDMGAARDPVRSVPDRILALMRGCTFTPEEISKMKGYIDLCASSHGHPKTHADHDLYHDDCRECVERVTASQQRQANWIGDDAAMVIAMVQGVTFTPYEADNMKRAIDISTMGSGGRQEHIPHADDVPPLAVLLYRLWRDLRYDADLDRQIVQSLQP